MVKRRFILVLAVLLLGIVLLAGCGDKQEEGQAVIKMGTNVEFLNRDDGIPGLEKAYGFKFDRDALTTMKTGLTYDALRNNKLDVAMGFATDGRIAAFDLVSLEDDKNYFPVYNPAPTIRKEILDEYPELADVINKLPPVLDQKNPD